MGPIDKLRQVLREGDPFCVDNEKPAEHHHIDYTVWRFIHAWRRNPLLGPDHGALLRQVGRWYGGDLYLPELLGHGNWYRLTPDVRMTPSGTYKTSPFVPPSLINNQINPDKGLDSKPDNRRAKESIPAEAYLTSLKFNNWYSCSQKEAVWTALTSPPRSSTMIALPTGAGKSLCFQILSRFGTGLTVVIVPTVALAIDQWHSAVQVLGHIPDLRPLYYAGNDPQMDPSYVIEQLRGGQTRLLFTSPEACVSGRLKPVLEQAAASGNFANLVIDEAHMIETWGMYFRVDFQMLSQLRRGWLFSPGSGLRTFLLSATFTPECRRILRGMFCEEGTLWLEFVSQRLRPEIDYYFNKFTGREERDELVLECARHLPRPAIIYTTEVDEAEQLSWKLTDEGFTRVGCFTGETSSSVRRDLLDAWRNDHIDLMVATSAFGMGVDKPDVRTVVHACFPENLHRYYQEVGRGGRDGAASLSVLLPTIQDEQVASSLAPKLLRPETIQMRWEGLLKAGRRVDGEDFTWDLRLNAKAVQRLGTRTWSEHVRWNKRLILQLLRGGLLDLIGIDFKPPEEEDGGGRAGVAWDEWARVKLHFSPHRKDVGELVRAQREEELRIVSNGLRQMSEVLNARSCISHILRSLYGPETRRVCGGCPACRRAGTRFIACPPLPFPGTVPATPTLGVVLKVPSLFRKQSEEQLVRFIRRAVKDKHIRRFACPEQAHTKLLSVFTRAISANDTLYPYRLDAYRSPVDFTLLPSETLAFFHVGELDNKALDFRGGNRIFHLLGADVRHLDANGRFPLEQQNARLYPSPDYWLEED